MEEHEKQSKSLDHDPKTGKFRPGNTAAKGLKNPSVAQANRMRATFQSEFTEAKVRMAINVLFKLVMAGDVRAIKAFLDYAEGTVAAAEIIERLRRVEQAAGMDTGASYDEPLKSPLLDFEFDRDGRPMPVRGKPRPIRRIVNDEDGDHE